MRMQILNWKDFEKNTLKGIFDLELASAEFTILLRGATYHEKGDSIWVGMPAKPYKTKGGADAWANIVDWPSSAAKCAFLNAVQEKVREYLARG